MYFIDVFLKKGFIYFLYVIWVEKLVFINYNKDYGKVKRLIKFFILILYMFSVML